MVWKEPGKDQDPWKNTERPPELERWVKNLHKRFGWLLGKKGGGQSHFRAVTLWWLLPVIIAVWLLTGIYKVAPGARGVHFVFGRFTQVVQPGLHWHAPWPIGQVELISGVEGRDYTRSYNRLLTGDGNIVTVDAIVQYHVADMQAYLFNSAVTTGPGDSADAGTRSLLGTLTDAAIRVAVAHSKLADILGTGQDVVEANANQRLVAALKPYGTGITVTGLTFRRVSLPQSVTSTDTDISAAQQAAEQAKTAAQNYAAELLPPVTSTVDATLAQAETYRTTLVNQAQADTAGFAEVLAAYRKTPTLTRDLLYTQTMQEILTDADKIVVDTRTGNVTVQWPPATQIAKPVTKVPAPSKASAGSAGGASANPSPSAAPTADSRKVQP